MLRRKRSSQCREDRERWPSARQHRKQQQRDDIGDLDHRIHGRTGGVFIGIADRIAGHRRLVGVGTLAAVMAVLNVLLGVVPRAAARRHRDRHEQTGDDHTKQHRAERRERRRLAHSAAAGDEVDEEVDDDRRQYRQQRRYDHFLDRRLGQQVDGAAVIGFVPALHDAGALAKLAPHLLDDRGGGTADRGHAHRAEQIGQHAAEQETGHHVRIGQREIRRDAQEIRVLFRAGDEELEVFVVGREQHQRAEARRTDRIALGYRLGGVADGVQRIGRLAHFLRQSCHFGNAAGVVGYRTESIERHHHAGQRQHRRHRDGDAEQAGEIIADQDSGDDHQRRKRRRFHRNGQTLDDIGAVAGHRSLRDRMHGTEIGAGIILGDPDDQPGHRKTDDAAEEQRLPGVAHAGQRAEADQLVDHDRNADERQDRRDQQAFV